MTATDIYASYWRDEYDLAQAEVARLERELHVAEQALHDAQRELARLRATAELRVRTTPVQDGTRWW